MLRVITSVLLTVVTAMGCFNSSSSDPTAASPESGVVDDAGAPGRVNAPVVRVIAPCDQDAGSICFDGGQFIEAYAVNEADVCLLDQVTVGCMTAPTYYTLDFVCARRQCDDAVFGFGSGVYVDALVQHGGWERTDPPDCASASCEIP